MQTDFVKDFKIRDFRVSRQILSVNIGLKRKIEVAGGKVGYNFRLRVQACPRGLLDHVSFKAPPAGRPAQWATSMIHTNQTRRWMRRKQGKNKNVARNTGNEGRNDPLVY